MTPSFSVIVPTFGRPTLLRDAVTSVLTQTVGDFECLVVDDGSSEPIEPFDDDRVLVIRRSENGGPAVARNTGLAEARGRAVLFLDDDDVFLPARLELAATGLERAPIATCWNRFIGQTHVAGRRLEGNVEDEILNRTTPQLGSVAVAAEAIAPFDERYMATEDVEWWLRMTMRHAVTTVPEVGLEIRRHEGERAGTGDRERIAGSLQLLSQYEGFFRRHPRAAAFRWKRIGILAAKVGDHRLARRAYLRSLSLRPSSEILWHLGRSTRPSSEHVRSTA